ncbi:septum formation family protein [Psychromicrobium sp. YIM B11713]|uniref:septum formation family protein n=1 Tax=Psychromicrobium sp. YIM B11713 TaxID=3145233 RepID=UPI00374F7F0D
MFAAMKSRRLGITAVAGGALVLGLSLSGCSLLDGGGPARDPSGTVTATSTSDAFQIKVGDCIQDPGGTSVTDVVSVPCSQPHDYEAFDRTLMKDGDYPGKQAVTDQADAYCEPAFEKFVGVKTEDSVLNMTYFFPTEESWKADDREILCLIAGEKEGVKVTGSLKGAKK